MIDFFSYRHSFLLHKALIDGLEMCGLLVDYCDVFISCLDSHSDGTHSLQRIHWWASDVMPNFSKSVPMKKRTYLHLGRLEGDWIKILEWTIPLWYTSVIPVIDYMKKNIFLCMQIHLHSNLYINTDVISKVSPSDKRKVFILDSIDGVWLIALFWGVGAVFLISEESCY